MLILVDSREQKPYWKGSQCAKTALTVGDYASVHSLNIYHIERKSLVDLYGTVTKGHLRFRKELLRAADKGIILEMVVEGSRKDFINKKFYKGNERLIKSETLDKMITTIQKRYKLKVYWCKSRKSAMFTVIKLLKQYER